MLRDTRENLEEEVESSAPRACCASCRAHALELEAADGGSASQLKLASGTPLLLVGDSHTYGPFGKELERLLVASGARVVREAKIGSAVKYWWPRLPALLRKYRPEVVIVGLGANMRDYPSAKGTSAQIQRTVALIRKELPSARIVWIGPPRRRGDTGESLSRFNGILTKGLSGQALFIDSLPYTPRYVGRDGVHYAAAPARDWARRVFARIASELSKAPVSEALESEEEFFELLEDYAVPPEITAFVAHLAHEWSRQRQGTPAPAEMSEWLFRDYQETLEGARKRFGKKFGKGAYSREAVGRAWMVSREQNMRFQAGSPGVKPLGKLAPPVDAVTLVTSASIEGSDKAPVAPLLVRFVAELRRRYVGTLSVSNYRGHGGGAFTGRGYSLDLFIAGRDARGFYKKEDALRLLGAVHEAAAAVGAEFRVIYNDFDVADAFNRSRGKQHVIFMGTTRKTQKRVTGLNWHGPAPLILHFHLDLTPRAKSR
jgi:hypothetical protein